MEKFILGVVIGSALMSIIIALADPYEKGMIAVESGQYSCDLEERKDKTTLWVCREEV